MKKLKKVGQVIALGAVLALTAYASVRNFDGDPKPPCAPGEICTAY